MPSEQPNLEMLTPDEWWSLMGQEERLLVRIFMDEKPLLQLTDLRRELEAAEVRETRLRKTADILAGREVALRSKLEQAQAEMHVLRARNKEFGDVEQSRRAEAGRLRADRDAERARAEQAEHALAAWEDHAADLEAELAALTPPPDKPGWHYAETAFPVTEAQE